jgi:hypothetical protein
VAYIELLIEENTSETGNTQLDARACSRVSGRLFSMRSLPWLLRCDALYYDANGFERAASEGPYEVASN